MANALITATTDTVKASDCTLFIKVVRVEVGNAVFTVSTVSGSDTFEVHYGVIGKRDRNMAKAFFSLAEAARKYKRLAPFTDDIAAEFAALSFA
jgi:hypothetical protein